jgi:hypothetical protein
MHGDLPINQTSGKFDQELEKFWKQSELRKKNAFY